MSAIENYLAANMEFETAKRELSTLANLVREVGTQLFQNPERFYFSNVSGEGLPIEIALNRSSKNFDANQWPTPQQIHTVMVRRFHARQAVEAAWAAVPPAMQSSLVPPRT